MMRLFEEDQELYEELSKPQEKIKGADWSKMMGRRNSWVAKPLYKNEDRFNNFSFDFSPKNSKSFRFKNSPRINGLEDQDNNP